MKIIAFLLTIIIFSACSINPVNEFEKDKSFPKVKTLSDYEESIFLPALETAFNNKKNGIYAASLLFAWEEIRNEISLPIEMFTSDDLAVMNNSNSYKNVLARDEYFTSVMIEDSIIEAYAYFKKSLPFIIPLEKDDIPLQFLDEKVISFGFDGYNETAGIIYYQNDDDFAIRLYPKEKAHEIVLMKSQFSDNLSLLAEIKKLEKNDSIFRENRNNKNDWKYYFNDEDRVSIPIIEFNIETNYSQIEGSYFSTSKNLYKVQTAYQRTAFVLNEKGAEVESEAVMEAATEEMEKELPKPKRMIFDKPFLILLKRKDSNHPYFAMYVSNSELMKKK
ncbi:hypothetical protein ACFL6I_07035 [candidate division KSB1 bacterium]